MAIQKIHHYLFASTLVYMRKMDDSDQMVQKMKPFNAVVTTPNKLVTYELMDRARKAVLQRAWDEMGISLDNVVDYHVNNFSYMGLMSSEEFSGRKAN